MCCFFFFKQKTAYEMRISDWSSDVCSSDLSYGYGVAGRMAMQAYLATAGSAKVGFTVTGKDGHGQPIHIGGMRGAIERNAMRYYLAIDTHPLGSASCRGRRCQYVSCTGDADTLKKKKNHTKHNT